MMNAILSTALIFSNFKSVDVVRVVDGDTIVVALPNVPEVFRHMYVRLKSIDTPEMHAKRKCERRDALVAKEALEDRLRSAKPDLLFCTGDKFFRLDCQLMAGDMDVSQDMREQGYGFIYNGGKKRSWTCKGW